MDGLRNVVIEEVISISDSDSSRSSALVAPNRRITTVQTEVLLQQSSPLNNEEIVTLSSASERCPVTWSGKSKSKPNFLNPDTFFSPSPRSKVSHWLTENAIQYYSQKQIELESTLGGEPLVENPLDNDSPTSTNKSSIIIRQDYNKDKTNVQSTSCSKLINSPDDIENKNNTLVLESSFDLSKQSSDNSNTSRIEMTDNNIAASQFQKSTNESNLITSQNTEMSNCEQVNDVDIEEIPTTPPLSARKLVEDMLSACSPSEISIESTSKRIERRRDKSLTDVPLSPETQKKIELCEYLKLMNMNPANGTSVAIRQNRRSSRVKHLALLSEKKELERRLNTEGQGSERKKSVKSSDGDSKHSSDNDKGSKSSSSKRASNATPVSSISSSLPLQCLLTPQERTVMDEGSTKPKQLSENRTPSEKRSGSKTPSKLFEVTTSEKSKVPAKYLQVHEVSTTSISKVKSSTRKERVQVKGSERKPMTLRKSNSSVDLHVKEKKLNNGTPKSLDVSTRKSFAQLHMDVKKLKPVRNMRQLSLDSSLEETSKKVKSVLNFSFAELALKLPNIVCDFDTSVKSFLNEIPKNNNNKNNKKVNNFINNNNNNKSKNLKRCMSSTRKNGSDGGPKAKVRKLNGALRKILRSTASKFKIRRTKEKTNEKAKRPSTRLANKLEKHKMYGSPLHINKLRSRGRLKQIRMKNVLLKDQKKKSIKKKMKQKLLAFNKEKDFKTTEMIQHGHENDLKATKESLAVKEVMPPPPLEVLEKSPSRDISPTKFATPNRMKKRLPDPEVWKNFTLEHRKAYIESIKFIKEEGNILIRNDFSPNKVVNKESILEKKDNRKDKAVVEHEEEITCNTAPTYGFQTPKSCIDRISIADIKRQVNTPALSTVSSLKDKVQPSSEDLEVDRLMRGKQVKDQATQKDDESPHVNNTSSDIITSDPSRSLSSHPSSSSSSSSSNSSSLQTVQSNSEPIPSTSKQDILEIPLENCSPPIDGEVEVNGTHSITPCSSIKDSDDQDDYEDKELLVGPGIPEVVNISQIEPTTCEYVHLTSNDSDIKTLHHCLTQPKQKLRDKSRDNSPATKQNWEETFHADKSAKSDRKALKQSHTIFLSNNNGAVINAYYVDFNLVVVQELMIGFWNQTPLGNILGAQDMWISKGSTRRMVLGNGCIGKESSETVISCNNSVAYIELWTKEHKSDKRERPVADVFVAIYMRLNRNGPDKKVLQLENIKGFASDVQYIVLRSCRSIIVSWTVNADSNSSTVVHRYHLSPDFQMVSSITEMQAVDHYISSLHNIEDCDTLIMGCGEAKLTLWNLEHGYIVATIDLMEIHPRPRAIWAKCDRGFLFTIHQSNDNILQLIAINSFDSTWKRLQTYKPRLKHKNFLGVCMEHGVLVAFYDSGTTCWSAQTGEQVVEETCEDGVFLPFGKHVVVVLNNQVHVRHALEYFVTTAEDS